MRTGCYLVAAILSAHAGAAFAGGYLRVTGPPPLRFESPPPPLTVAVSANAKPAPRTSDVGTQPCPTNSSDDAVLLETATITTPSLLTETNSSPAIVVESGSSAATPTPDQPAEQPPLTSQVLAEIFRQTAGTSSNQSTTVVLPGGFVPPQPAPSRSSSATYTDH
jgi:hypothetical protein